MTWFLFSLVVLIVIGQCVVLWQLTHVVRTCYHLHVQFDDTLKNTEALTAALDHTCRAVLKARPDAPLR